MKTTTELKTYFIAKYSIDEVTNSKELSMLWELLNQNKNLPVKDIKFDKFNELIKKYL